MRRFLSVQAEIPTLGARRGIFSSWDSGHSRAAILGARQIKDLYEETDHWKYRNGSIVLKS